jgi:hypothetical protein
MAFEQFGLEIILVFAIVHLTAVIMEWYNTYPDVDVITHFLGGMALGILVKNVALAVALILLWEVIEIVLSRPWKKEFNETLPNKVRDVIIGFAGWAIVVVF